MPSKRLLGGLIPSPTTTIRKEISDENQLVTKPTNQKQLYQKKSFSRTLSDVLSRKELELELKQTNSPDSNNSNNNNKTNNNNSEGEENLGNQKNNFNKVKIDFIMLLLLLLLFYHFILSLPFIKHNI